MFALVTSNIGSIDSIKLSDVPVPSKMGPEDVFLEHTAFGFNHEDFAIAMGRYPFGYYARLLSESSEKILGLEGTGVVAKAGSKVSHLQVGQRVFYSVGLLGAYCAKRAIHSSFLQLIPDNVSNDTVASCMRKGLMVHSLLYKTVSIQKGSTILVHNATDPLELMLCSWAASVGLQVIGTVGRSSDVPLAESYGCSLAIDRSRSDVVQEVARFTAKKGVKVLYDSVGAGLEKSSIACLEPFGVYVHYHSKNGFPDISAASLAPKSLFLTTPSLELYKSNRVDLMSGSEAVFKALAKGYIKPILTRLPIKNARSAFDAYGAGDFSKNYVFLPS